MIKLSIIIPVYNVESYIEKCLRSCAEQDISSKEYEIIVINDGTKDNSLEIAENTAKDYSNIKIYSQQNAGLSAARNKGLSVAKGDYIYFVDSDDYLLVKNLNSILQSAIKYNVDCLSFNYKKIDENGNKVYAKMYYQEEGIVKGSYILNTVSLSSPVWRYLIRRKLLIDNKIYFTHGIYHEDEEFITLVYSYAKRVKHLNMDVYAYIQHENSIMNTESLEVKIKKINDLIIVLSSLNKRRANTSFELYNGLSRKIEQLSIGLFFRMREAGFTYKEVKDIVERLKELNLFPLKIRYNNYKFKIASFCFNSLFFRRIYFK